MPVSSLLIIVCTALLLGVGTIRLLADGHPENGCSHGDKVKRSINDRFYNKADRPAGPDAEDAALERETAPPKPPSFRRRLRLLKSS